jgi:hypothetical protein
MKIILWLALTVNLAMLAVAIFIAADLPVAAGCIGFMAVLTGWLTASLIDRDYSD